MDNFYTSFVISKAADLDDLFLSAFVSLAGVALFASSWIRHSNSDLDFVTRWGGAAIGLIAGIFTLISGWQLISLHDRLRGSYDSGNYALAVGCLNGFDPSTSPTHTPDRIMIGGKVFSYSDNIDNGGFHDTEISGGPIHSDTMVKIYYVDDIIIRLDVARHKCPSAPRF